MEREGHHSHHDDHRYEQSGYAPVTPATSTNRIAARTIQSSVYCGAGCGLGGVGRSEGMLRWRGEMQAMTKEDDYRRFAAETVDLASRASSTEDKGRLRAMAEAWLDLADRAHRVLRQHASRLKEHPLLRSRLGGDRQEVE